LADRYRLERELGHGGMATVYLATDLRHEREVALKVLKPELAAVLGAERFLAEVKITARLHHPHILTLIDSGEADGQLYYVLPYVRGDSLRARLNQEKQLGLEEALHITRQIAGALDYAHQQGVIHRDIKPENILFHEGEAMLADFGIALAVKQAGGNRLTETGLSLGTPQYMSPEQATGDRALDARSDVYSLGAVLYEMLAGEPPVTGPTVQAVIAKLLTERPTRLRVVRDTVPEGVDTAVGKALAKVPSDRYASAGQLAAALDRAAAPASPASGRNIVRWAVPLGVAALAIAAVLILKPGRPAAPAVRPAPVRTQVTFTGNTFASSVSPDGSRIAFASTHCDAQGHCAHDVIVQDLGGSGTLTVMRGVFNVWDTAWSPDGRYLLVNGAAELNWGVFLVPATVQGAPRYLGCCSASFLNGSDSVLLNPVPRADSVQVLRVITPGDGVTHDTVPLARRPVVGTPVFPSPDGRWLAFGEDLRDSVMIVIADRSGRRRASWVIPDAGDFTWSPAGHGVLITQRAGTGLLWDIVFRAVDPRDGQLIGAPETVLTGLESGTFGLSHDGGVMTFEAGPRLQRVVALTRTDPTSLRFSMRTLVSSTANLQASIPPRGNRLAVVSQIAAGERPRFKLALIPFDSGPETVVVPQAERIVDWVWPGVDGGRLIYGLRTGQEDIRYSAFDAATGQSRALFTLPNGLGRDGFVQLQNGKLAFADILGRKVYIVTTGGTVERAYPPPSEFERVALMRTTPSHPQILLVAWDKNNDSILVSSMHPDDGRLERVGALGGEGWRGAKQLDDGSVQVVLEEDGEASALWAFPARGGPARRLGSMPFGPASYGFSSDGKRLVATVRETKADVWLITNFKDLLPKP
jgi:hypothetical protein